MTLRLTIQDLSCVRGGRTVLKDISVSVGGGEALLVTGPNGIGKSTLLRLIAGLLRPDRGKIAFTGGPEGVSRAEHCHYFGHQDGLKSALTVIENLDFWYRFYGSNGPAPADALETVGLRQLADLPAGSLSAGQRRRVAFARMRLCERPVWLMDEPTSALDERAEAAMLDAMRAHYASGGILISATHLPLALPNAATLRLTKKAA